MPSRLISFPFYRHPLSLKRHGLTSHIIYSFLFGREDHCYWVCLFFLFNWLNLLLFVVWHPHLLYVRYEFGLSTLCSDIRGDWVSLPLRHILLTNCMIEAFFGFVCLPPGVGSTL